MQPEADLTRTSAVVATEPLPLPEVGTIVEGRYRIVRPIGVGGMGAVYEAEQIRLGRRCALKFLRTELSGRSRSEARFRREARLLAQLEHEHLTAVLDCGAYLERSPFLVMEYLDGCTLKSLLTKQGSLAVGDALAIIRQVAEGMAHVHAQGIVHRDLKPDNLMLLSRSGGTPWVKILDFGIARALEDGSDGITVTGADLGTVAYMSPEQARGVKKVTASVDVFAVGTILYEALSGVRPHPGESYNAAMFHLLTQKHEPLGRVLPDCSPELEAIVERCLEKDARQRYQDAGELFRALSAISVSSEVSARVNRGGESVSARLYGFRRALLRMRRGFIPGAVLGAVAALSLSRGGERGDGHSAATQEATPMTDVVSLQVERGGTEAAPSRSGLADHDQRPHVTTALALAAESNPRAAVPLSVEESAARVSAAGPQSARAGYRMAAVSPVVPAAPSALQVPVQAATRSGDSPLAEAAGDDGSPFVTTNPYGAE